MGDYKTSLLAKKLWSFLVGPGYQILAEELALSFAEGDKARAVDELDGSGRSAWMNFSRRWASPSGNSSSFRSVL